MPNPIKVCLIRRAADGKNPQAYGSFIRKLLINAASGGSYRERCKCKDKRGCLNITKQEALGLYEVVKKEHPAVIGEFLRLFQIPTTDEVSIAIATQRMRVNEFFRVNPDMLEESSSMAIIIRFTEWCKQTYE